MITEKNILQSIQNRDVFVVKNFYDGVPTWNQISNLYDQAKGTKDLEYVSFATMAIRNSSLYSNIYNELISLISKIHNGQLFSALTIIHFISATNNKINDKDAIQLKDKFNSDNTHQWPNHLIITDDGVSPKEDFQPTIHSDAADGFFVQGDGESLWRIFDNFDNLRYTHVLSRGDLMYIPRDIRHSVESLCPRHAVSISFDDYKFTL